MDTVIALVNGIDPELGLSALFAFMIGMVLGAWSKTTN